MLQSIHPLLIRLRKCRCLLEHRNSAKRRGLVVALIGSVLIAKAAWPQSCTPNFVITPTPNGPQQNRLNGVAAFDVNDVWAVGFTNGNVNDQTLIEHWDGSSWTIVPSPNQEGFSTLSAVGGIATDDLWAVGSFHEGLCCPQDQTLTEHWDGVQWSVVPSPNLQGFEVLNAGAAVATDDVWAVGQNTRPNFEPLFMHWDGQGWS